MSQISTELAFAKEVAAAGAETAFRHFGGELQRQKKKDGSWVTQADKAAEAEVRRLIGASHPDHNILGEEEGLRGADGGEPKEGAPTWVVDPIDGTNNFMLGIPIWATLVALKVDGNVVLGVCNAPALGEIYEGERGGGARCNDRSIHADQATGLAEGVVMFSSIQSFLGSGLDGFFDQLIRRSRRSRGFGDFWGHMLVARGAAQVMVEPSLATWDVAALLPIVSEAGARLTHLHGDEWSGSGSALTTTESLHEEVTALARTTAPDWSEPQP